MFIRCRQLVTKTQFFFIDLIILQFHCLYNIIIFVNFFSRFYFMLLLTLTEKILINIRTCPFIFRDLLPGAYFSSLVNYTCTCNLYLYLWLVLVVQVTSTSTIYKWRKIDTCCDVVGFYSCLKSHSCQTHLPVKSPSRALHVFFRVFRVL